MAYDVVLLVFENCDLLDVGGPYEVLLTANRLASRRGEPAPFSITTVSYQGRAVAAYGGLRLLPTMPAESIDDLDVLVVPGIVNLDAVLGDADLVTLVRSLSQRAEITTSVCTGAFLLAAAGVLDGRPATTHHEDLELLRARDDVGEVRSGVRWVDDGDVITAAGLSSGIAFALHLVDRVVGRDLAVATAEQIEYAWDPDGLDAIPG